LSSSRFIEELHGVANPADSSFFAGDARSSSVARHPPLPSPPRCGQPGHGHLHPSFTDEELQGEAPKLEEHRGFHQFIGHLSSAVSQSSATPPSSLHLDELPSQRSCPAPSTWTIGALVAGLVGPRRPLHWQQSRHRSRSDRGDQPCACIARASQASPTEIANELGRSDDFGL
jgi:hypothetical protein